MSEPPPSRPVITGVAPVVAGGRHPVQRVVGEPVDVEATVLVDGHDGLLVATEHRAAGGEWGGRTWMRSTNPGLDRWAGTVVPTVRGRFEVRLLAWVDEWGSWVHHVERKLATGAPDDEIRTELEAGAALLRRVADGAGASVATRLRSVAGGLEAGDLLPLRDASLAGQVAGTLTADRATTSAPLVVDVQRERALFATWYELFPRSCGAPGRHGTFADVTAQIPDIADLGFDILYLPPIHPIGTTFRKGPNNAEQSQPGDPGSPWAIGDRTVGSHGGGHTDIHPELGTHDDLRALVAAADDDGLEVALDLAFQCAPDHPWVHDHPAWFRHRPDGSIQYAENPPKKYQDVYPLDFTNPDWEALWAACLDVVRFWIDHGITIFRVDNPHTKPFAFWEWLLAEVAASHPDVLFLSEAFTRPAVMHQLTRIGFTSSYSYFPWRRTKDELIAYFTELSTAPSVDEFRPSAWPNTPDILADQLWGAPRELFEIRYLLAATLCPSVGIYGPAYELCVNVDAGNGKEEYLDSEKYDLVAWDRADPVSIAPLIGEVNRLRHEHLALHTLRTLRFHDCGNDQLLVFSKTAHSGPSVDPANPARASILVVVNLDPSGVQAATVELDLVALGVDPDRPYVVHDLLADRSFTWKGPSNFVELRPHEQPGHVFRVTQP